MIFEKVYMQSTDKIIVQRATIENAEEILELQKIAYASEAELYNDLTIPPLHQTLKEILSEFNQQVFLKITLEKRIIGSVRCRLEKETCHIGKLIIHPEQQNCGIGTRLLHAAENQFPEAERYELFTGQKSIKNLHIYEKNGYRIFNTARVSEKLTFVFLEKKRRENRILMKRRDTFEDAEEIKICHGDIDYQGIVKHINEGIVIIREGIVVFANDAFYEISQKKPENVISSDFSGLVATVDRERIAAYCKERLFTEDLHDRIEFLMTRDDGDAVIEMKSRVVACGGAPGLLGALTDITERRKTRAELQRLKERLESILHSMNEAIVSLSPDGYRIIAVNPAAEALYGIPLREFISGEKHIFIFIHPDDLERVKHFYDNLPEAEFDQAQYRIISSNNKVKWVLDEGHVVYVRGGTIRRIDHVIKDITEEKKAIDALRQSEAKYKDFFNSTSDMAFAISPEGVFIDINDAGLKLLGFASKEEALASNVKDFYVDIKERIGLLKEIYGKGHVVGRQIKFKNKQGGPIEAAITARVKMDDSGHVLYHEGIVHNMSKAMEDQRNRVLRNAAGGMCHYLNSHLMQLHASQKAIEEEMASLTELIENFVDRGNPQETTMQIKSIMETMRYFHNGSSNAYERISEVTKAFNKAFFYKEEPYSTDTILDIFRSHGYKGDD